MVHGHPTHVLLQAMQKHFAAFDTLCIWVATAGDPADGAVSPEARGIQGMVFLAPRHHRGPALAAPELELKHLCVDTASRGHGT